MINENWTWLPIRILPEFRREDELFDVPHTQWDDMVCPRRRPSQYMCGWRLCLKPKNRLFVGWLGWLTAPSRSPISVMNLGTSIGLSRCSAYSTDHIPDLCPSEWVHDKFEEHGT